MTISMPRGDRRTIVFTVTEEGTPSDIEFTEIYATFKSSYVRAKMLFQKKLSDGSIWKDDDGAYAFSIEPEDTDELSFGDYVFDIELLYHNEIKQTFVGDFILTPEVTFASNE